MKTRSPAIVAAALMGILIMQGTALAHAFLDHAEPAVGSKVREPPAEVRVWFTEELEPAFSALKVFNADGREVDKKDSHLDTKDRTLLIVSLPKVPAGTYKVVWEVVATDTHRTHGDFKFEVKPRE